jgi:kumamolisin
MTQRKLFHDSVVELPQEAAFTPTGVKVNARGPEHSDEKMTVSFSLSPDKAVNDELEARVAQGDVVPIDELQKKYGVTEEAVAPLLAWRKKEGFEVVHVAPDRNSVFARATVSQIERSLGVDMAQVTRHGITYTAARNAPSLPANVAAHVRAIGGLQPFRRAQKHLRRFSPSSPTADDADEAAGPAPNIANAPPYLVSEVLKAYNADGLGVTGKGQTIAILIDTVPSNADLKAFWTRNGLHTTIAQVTKINVSSVPLPPTEGEETLDAQWTSGIAPGAHIRIYASGSLEFAALDRALDRILVDLTALPGMRQLSISLGLGETFMSRTQHAKFLRLVAAGVNVFVSSGDAGSNPDSTGQGSTGPLQAEYASSDSSVVGVGGTSLSLAATGAVRRESGWPDSGGGRSVFFGRSAWQKGSGVPSGRGRLVPDVSLAADPNTGALGDLQRPRAADRRHELERARLGGLLRADQRGATQSRQAAARLSQSALVSTGRQRELPRHHQWQQWRVRRRPRL